jgi:hypothetical protein
MRWAVNTAAQGSAAQGPISRRRREIRVSRTAAHMQKPARAWSKTGARKAMRRSYARLVGRGKAFRPTRICGPAEIEVGKLLARVRSSGRSRGLLGGVVMSLRRMMMRGGLLRRHAGISGRGRCVSRGGCRGGRSCRRRRRSRRLSENRSSSQGSNQGCGHQGELHSVSKRNLRVDRACASAGRAYEAARANAIPFGHETSESSAFFSVMRRAAHAER